MPITATELKTNLGMYLDMSESKDIYISKNGVIIAKLSGVKEVKNKKKSIDNFKKLSGILHSNYSVEDIRNERLAKI